MTYCYYLFLTITIITFQTVVFPSFFNSDHLYDFLIPLVLYLGVYRQPAEGLIVITGSGLIVESLSAGPVGLYITSYFWIYSVIRWGRQFLYVGNRLFYPVIVVLGILIQHLIVLIAFWVMKKEMQVAAVMGGIAGQVLWGLITGPLLIIFIRLSHKIWRTWFKRPITTSDHD